MLEILNKFRIESEMSITQLAHEIKMNPSTLTRWISRQHNPHDYMLTPVRKYMKSHIDEIARTLGMDIREMESAVEN